MQLALRPRKHGSSRVYVDQLWFTFRYAMASLSEASTDAPAAVADAAPAPVPHALPPCSIPAERVRAMGRSVVCFDPRALYADVTAPVFNEAGTMVENGIHDDEVLVGLILGSMEPRAAVLQNDADVKAYHRELWLSGDGQYGARYFYVPKEIAALPASAWQRKPTATARPADCTNPSCLACKIKRGVDEARVAALSGVLSAMYEMQAAASSRPDGSGGASAPLDGSAGGSSRLGAADY